MKIIKRCIFIIGMLLLMILLIIAAVNKYQKQNSPQVEVADISGIVEPNLKKLEDHSTYYFIEKTMNSYYLYLEVGNNNAVYSLLDKEYTSAKEINSINAIEKISTQIQSDNKQIVEDIHIKENSLYPIYLIKTKDRANPKQKKYYIFYKDNVSVTYSIEPILEEDYELYLQGKKELKAKESKIVRNEYNVMQRLSLSEEEKIKEYVRHYQQNIKYDIEEAYNSLNEQYKLKKFDSIEKYKEYLDNVTNTDNIEKYRIVKYDEYTQYICIDNNKNYYIFNSTSAFEYNVILDNYTIDTEDFLQRYNDASEQEKVLMNLEKLSNAINSQDYEYVYNKLDETFKQTNYKTLQDFENYIKQNYNINNEIAYNIYENVAGVNILDATIKNQTENKEYNIKIVMKIKDGTDFVMSFGKLQ